MAEHGAQAADGEPHDVVVVAVQPFHKETGQSLNAVGPGLVHGFAGGHIGVDFPLGQGTEPDVGHHGVGDGAAAPADGDAGHHLMVPARQGREHGRGFFGGAGLAQHPVLQDHHRVGGHNHRVVSGGFGNGRGLLGRQTGHLIERILCGVHGLVDVGGGYREGKAHAGQQLPPPGRLGGENQFHISKVLLISIT